MRIGTVTELWRYPVKSLRGERLAEARLQVHKGVLGDRGWAVRDEAKGEIRGGRNLHALVQAESRYVAEPDGSTTPDAEITLPDGTRFLTSDPQAANHMSRLVGRTVTLWPQQAPEAEEFYRRAPPDNPDLEAEYRALFGRVPGEPLPDMRQFPEELMTYVSPRGTFFDVWPLHFLTRATLAALQAEAPGSRIDVRRFRPNFVIDVAESGFVEQGWVGRRIRVGEVLVEVPAPCPRCVITTLQQADLPKEPQIMRAIVRAANQNIGAYGSVIEPGRIRLGDPVELAA
ncbi:MAG TPA: MOSC domain-containing protein [Stellaceae bacterium]|nr:MOSC domain-containing protein [Stellaceae bacterium]